MRVAAPSKPGAGHLARALVCLVVGSGCYNGLTRGGDVDGGPPAGDDMAEAPADLSPAATIGWTDNNKPVVDKGGGETLPAGISDLFQAALQAAAPGPCLVEPEAGAMLPASWMRPRFRLSSPAGQNVFEIRVHTEGTSAVGDLLVYTSATAWTMEPKLWARQLPSLYGRRITVTVRSAILDLSDPGHPTLLNREAFLGDVSTFSIAPKGVIADGTITYWSGGKSTNPTLMFAKPSLTEARGSKPLNLTEGNQCQGCHVPAPDPNVQFAAFTRLTEPFSTAGSTVDVRTLDNSSTPVPWVPSWSKGAAHQILAAGSHSVPSFSPAHFRPGDRIMLTAHASGSGSGSEIAWVDLETNSTAQYDPRTPTVTGGWGIVPRFFMGMGGGDQGQAASPVFSRHLGDFIVYASASSVINGFIVTDGDIKTVAWNGGRGQSAQAVAGADNDGANNDSNEFAPALSPDDRLIAFVRVPKGESSFANQKATIWIVPRKGGAAVPLAANQPPQNSCAGSGVVGNGAPHFAPSWTSVSIGNNTYTYYWLVYSSKRGDGVNSRIYTSAVIYDENPKAKDRITTTAPLYLWNQPEPPQAAGDISNHNPVWEDLGNIDQAQGLAETPM